MQTFYVTTENKNGKKTTYRTKASSIQEAVIFVKKQTPDHVISTNMGLPPKKIYNLQILH